MWRAQVDLMGGYTNAKRTDVELNVLLLLTAREKPENAIAAIF